MRLPGNLAPLGYRNYSLYWLGHATTKLGRAVEDMGAVWLVYELTGSALLLGLLGLVRAAPAILLGPIGGAMADRVDQRRMLYITQGMWMSTSLALGVLVLLGGIELWHVYLLVGIKAIATTFDGSVREAFFPRLVPREHIGAAVTLSAIAGRGAALVGPIIGGFAVALAGEASPFLITAGTFPVLMVAVAMMRGIVPLVAAEGSTLRGELVEGLRYVLRAPVLSGLLTLQLVFEIFQMNPVMITIIGREVLDVGPEGLGGLLSAPALGSLIAIVVVLVTGHANRQGRFAVLCTIAYAAALAGFALSGVYAVCYVALVFVGALDSFLTVTRHSVMQLAAPSHMRGRVMGNMGTVTRGVSPLAETQSGVLAGIIGGPLAIVAAAGALVVSAAATARGNPALWRLRRTDLEHEPDVDPPGAAVTREPDADPAGAGSKPAPDASPDGADPGTRPAGG
ncbi:MAG TPA: MFS transporter [Actinophytocola sp.]|nr:MFS transporter [Actinophytocola sp.]